MYEGCGGAITAERIPPVLNAPNSRREIYVGICQLTDQWWSGGCTLMFHSGSISLASVSVAPSRAEHINKDDQEMNLSRYGVVLTVFRCGVPPGGWLRDETNVGRVGQ